MEQELSMQSLNKVLDILQLFLDTKREMALSEISESLGLNKTTVSRIIRTLLKRGYLSQRRKRGNYFLGTIYVNFIDVVMCRSDIVSLATPDLVQLSRNIDEVVTLSLINGKHTLSTETFYDSSSSNHILRVIPDKRVEGLYNNSIGKILLANLSDEELQEYFDTHPIKRNTPNTLTSINEIKKNLLTIKKEDVAFDYEEESIGIRSVASGLRNSKGKVIGAIGVIAPSVRLSRKRMRKLAPTVRNYAKRISKKLGI